MDIKGQVTKLITASFAVVGLVFGFAAPPATAAGLAVVSVTPGPNEFIKFVNLSGVTSSNLSAVSFTVAAKSGSTAREITATYSRSYLLGRGYLNTVAGTASVPVYGLYQSYTNAVGIVASGFSTSSFRLAITTGAWNNGCRDAYGTKNTIVPRNPNIRLDYSYFMLKGWVCGAHPVVMDVDGEVRWAGTAGDGNQGSTFFGNSFYLGGGSSLYKISLDGSYTEVGNYSALGYWNFHHNIDFGRDGMLLDLNHNSDVEADILEVSGSGSVIRNWDIGAIFDAAMTAGGDNPTGFVDHNYGDWLHNNAATYWPARNELVVSSRENFVVGIGYLDKKIKWILGDTDKAWYQNYPSLRKYALRLSPGSHPPIGQHAVSITSDGNLMLFDNGFQSFNHAPSGSSRGYSAPRQYRISTLNGSMQASEVWNYERNQQTWSPICSSIYQSGTSYLINYASEGGGIRLVGLDSSKRVAFEYQLPATAFYFGWNALPIKLDGLRF